MSTKASFWLRGKKGQLAGTTVYQSKGRTIQREIVPVSNPQTRAQMEQRVKWPNLVNTYKLLKPIMKYAFESKKGAQSDYNALMSVNASAPVVPAITKSEARMGVVIPAPYTITRGSLPTLMTGKIEQHYNLMTNIKLRSFEIQSDSTLAALSTAMLENNPWLREGMQISVIILAALQIEGNPVTTSLLKYEFLIDTKSEAPLSDFIPTEYLAAWEGRLSLKTLTVLGGGYHCSGTMILSETVSGKTRVSTEKIILDQDGQMLYEEYTDDAAINAAINSYGVQENAFLSSAEANKA